MARANITMTIEQAIEVRRLIGEKLAELKSVDLDSMPDVEVVELQRRLTALKAALVEFR